METYFAAEPTDKIGSALYERIEKYYRYVDQNGLYTLWKECFRQYYKGYFDKGCIEAWGKQGNKKKINVNHFKSLLDHIKVLVTNQRPVFDPRSINSDYKSQSQTILAKGLLDYYMRQKNMETVIDGSMDCALQGAEGYIMLEWNPDVGKIVGEIEVEEEPEGEEVITKVKREGDIEARSFHPMDVIRDFNQDTTEENLWYIVRRRVNKFDLAARYPKFKNEIINLDLEINSITNKTLDDYDFKEFGDSDLIHLYTFRHKKTAAMPEGRQVEFLDDTTVLFDGDLPYSDISIYPLMPCIRKNSNFGYATAFDMLPIQKAIDMLDSTVVTNQSTFGVQNIVARKGSGVTSSNLSGGLKLVEFSGDFEPKPLQLLSTPAEIFNYKQDLIQQMETIAGIASITRGNPEPQVKSGAYGALLQSMTIQFNSGLQHSYAQMLEKLGTGIINMLKDYADAPRVALIAGISNKAYLKEFKGEDLQQIDRVIVDMGNPVSRTLAGKMQIADTLVERGLIKRPDQYLQILETGTLDPLIEGKENEIMNIRSENEKLSSGQQVYALYADNHWLHIKEHKNVIASPDAREMTDIFQLTDAHIKEHINLLRTTDPGILMILGQQPIPSPMNSMGAGMGAPPVPPQSEEGTPQQGMVGTPPGTQENEQVPGLEGPNMPRLPSQPKNPLSGEQFNEQTGGL